ncbi:gamma-glutamyl-gamma-aminobutyrate hydrolase family protein [Vogesella sp. LIG4]|uniref:gamma-glutamyl-gamma-aminobutyrate hydrolase family protein n=1 Tax=Vogesella sp. LIG4 TaxID=1192162 RepID=UPI00081FEFE4|nr:gamma-glutamyl-gamma-aminobutyrate hydrolase family protein [Vogesella sp. LIG4]SCK28309.1 gamma-glutamyl-gamma-aminobutyrate hydrolase [Vogesella sp. LIG4]
MAAVVIGIASCCWTLERQQHHLVGEECIAAVSAMGAVPVLLPALAAQQPAAMLLSAIDGLLLPGSLSNIDPRQYGAPAVPGDFADPARDATNLPLIRAAVAAGVPLFGICRGLQEINVAFGGTLTRAVQDEPGRLDHREPAGEREALYQPAHDIRLVPGGLLHGWYGEPVARVNSLHQQGIARLAPALRAEAHAPDGLIEAVRVEGAAAFALGVQWHPEWRPQENRLSQTLFSAFRDSCLLRRQLRAKNAAPAGR